MQAIKEKITDLKEMRKAKLEAKEEEKAERELAKARLEVAHEVRMAREAEAAMDYHVQKAAEKAAEHEKKYPQPRHSGGTQQDVCADDDLQSHDSHGRNASAPPGGCSAGGDLYSGGAAADSGHNTAFLDASDTAAPETTGYNAGPPTHNNLL
ncbi:hypothetical protein C2S52_018554 [Perilla frutescens var. hirtella]|uniref:Late embryogenesis abundant protein n=1 Tax=Perilla frutescens var. hirtella TaxID=608512 RepID=A0AAD4NZV9_PERFH|nr:hypothetical protein C2S52_018554 [Perilla frutescens var. hirtella]KAH6813048.1 hypothetical protein C2S51_022066 [Perilla frutescens var. frutescens]KAH6820857.1 hypothetical protein C2S53_020082 [Perilla frutescens var. hirtella]